MRDDEREAITQLKSHVLEIIRSHEMLAQPIIIEDEERLLHDIGSAKILVPTTEYDSETGQHKNFNIQMAVSQVLGEIYENHSEIKYKLLQTHGIKACNDGVFLYPEVIERYLPKDSDWAGMKIFGHLKRIEGAEYTRRRIAEKNVRGFLLTKSKILGMEQWNRNGTDMEHPK